MRLRRIVIHRAEDEIEKEEESDVETLTDRGDVPHEPGQGTHIIGADCRGVDDVWFDLIQDTGHERQSLDQGKENWNPETNRQDHETDHD